VGWNSLILKESVACIKSSAELWENDSGLLHDARLLGKKNVSFWGPTDPVTRLQEFADVATEVYYQKIPCSIGSVTIKRIGIWGNNIILWTFAIDKAISLRKDGLCLSFWTVVHNASMVCRLH
jgi:ADP-heptose:LPS heptosyltransferase